MPRWPSPQERFDANWVAHPCGCHLWTASVTRNGYPRFRLGDEIAAHRAAWILVNGPIPPGLTIDHVRKRGCHFRHCVNVAHLEPVTQSENSHRTATGICANGHALDSNTYTNRGCKQCQKAAANRRYLAKKSLKEPGAVADIINTDFHVKEDTL